MASSGKKSASKASSDKRKRQQELAAEYEHHRQVRQEVILWGVVAVSLLLFISNFGIGGVIGGFFSDLLFGIFGFMAYLFPIILLGCTFFVISNRGNAFAAVKLTAILLIFVFFCSFLALLLTDEGSVTPAMAYEFGVDEKNGGGFIGGTVSWLLARAFGSVGAYIITVIGIIVSVVLLTGRLAIRGMSKKGHEVYETAREHQEERKRRLREGREAALAVSSFTVGPGTEDNEVTGIGRMGKSAGTLMEPGSLIGQSDPLNMKASSKVSESGKEKKKTGGKPDPLDLRASAKASESEPKGKTSASRPDPLDLRASAKASESEPKGKTSASRPDPLDMRAAAKELESEPKGKTSASRPDPLDLRAAARAENERRKATEAGMEAEAEDLEERPEEFKRKYRVKTTDSMMELSPDMEFELSGYSGESGVEEPFSSNDDAHRYDDFIEPNITGFVVKSLRADGSEPEIRETSDYTATVADNSLERFFDPDSMPSGSESGAGSRPDSMPSDSESGAGSRPGSMPSASDFNTSRPGRMSSAADSDADSRPGHISSAADSGADSRHGSLCGSSETRKPTEVRKEGEERKEAETEAGFVPPAPKPEPPREYVYPPIDLLKKAENKAGGNTEIELRETAMKLQQTLKTFGVNVKVTDISCGPAVTRYEIQPEMGVKVSKIVNLADDIKLNLAAADIRIEAPIPGKPAVGIEVPNKENVMVSFRELIESKDFQESKSKISFAVGRDIAGKVKVADIAKMPHVLIAGATGSGKSVCINTIIMSILYKAKPDEVKLIMIDPKVVELSVYNGIPHLMIPVVTDPKKAAGALNWAVQEMTDRYNKFAETGVRKFEEYNARIDKLNVPEGQERPEKMCQLVIIVDELADLMMVASHEVEDAICRLAQLARAAGIHLVIATQRPSVNVITGLIKANMPSRIAFAVTSGIDSRTILDMNGAEKLLGKGDMLFDPQGVPKPLRVQGAFVSDDEVSNVVSFLKDNNGGASYSSDIQKKVESLESGGNTTVEIDGAEPDDGKDSYFDEAAQIIVDKEKASIGMLQRYLKIGFNRAARIMDQLEEAGIVGPEEGTKPRKVLMSAEEYRMLTEGGVPDEIA